MLSDFIQQRRRLGISPTNHVFHVLKIKLKAERLWKAKGVSTEGMLEECEIWEFQFFSFLLLLKEASMLRTILTLSCNMPPSNLGRLFVASCPSLFSSMSPVFSVKQKRPLTLP